MAREAFYACRMNRQIVLRLKALSKGAHRKRFSNQFWRTRVTTTFYTLATGDVVVISDWQERCVKLSEPITAKNLPNGGML